MGREEVLQGVRQTRFEGLLKRHERGELSQGEAAEMLGVSERTFRRWRDRLRDKGPEGLRDRRIGKPSSRRAAAEEQLGIRDIAAYSPRAAQPLRARLPHLAGSATQGAGLAGSQRRLRGGPAAPSSPIAAAGCATSCASRRNAGWATTTPSNGGA